MQNNRQHFLAGLVREHLTQLDEVLAEVLLRDEPLSELEVRLLLDNANARLAPVEAALRRERVSLTSRLRRQRVPVIRGLRRAGRPVKAWCGPRIGLLYHYPPKPILLPARYFRTTPPNPAPTISVVTPSYQQGPYLERTLCSVLAQQYPALEYRVHDGGSTDESVDILARYEQSLTGWASERDGGQADAINRAFALTSGEIMGWVNSDDLLLPGALAYVAQYFVEHPSVDVVYGDRLMIDENDGQVGAWILPRHDDEALTLADYVPQETLFWRRTIWEAAGGHVDTNFAYALDWDLLLRFRAAGARMAHLPRFLGAFRVHEEQKTSSALPVGLAEMQQLRERAHGRIVHTDEALRRLRPYFIRHRVLHGRQRLLDRLPFRREEVTPSTAATAVLEASNRNGTNPSASLPRSLPLESRGASRTQPSQENS